MLEESPGQPSGEVLEELAQVGLKLRSEVRAAGEPLGLEHS